MFELPKLNYPKNALAPVMSEETLDFHHAKHHQTYILSTLIYNISLFKFYYFWIDLKAIIFWILIMNGTALDFESYHIFKFHFNFIFL